MSDTTNARKTEAIDALLRDPATDRGRRAFDAFRLRHRALPELDLAAIDPSTRFLGRRLAFPLIIASMTGGDHERLRRVNRNLAQAAEQAGVAMGVGSQRVLFTDPASRDSFALRPLAPSVPLLANLGAVQLNCGFGIEECRAAVSVLEADGLYLHLNPLQEAVQPEGNTNFAGLAARIGAVAGALDRPVLVKEVGAGLGLADARLLMARGVRHFDVAGSGGTSWSRVEHHRQPDRGGHDLGLTFQDWGTPTPEALRELAALGPEATLIASGGIRNGLDMAKAMAMGASLCSLARPFLEPAMESPEAVLAVLARLRREFVTALFLLGLPHAADLVGRTDLLAPAPAWLPEVGDEENRAMRL